MSLANEETRNRQRKTSWLPLSWGVRFTIAMTGSIVAWWVQARLLNGAEFAAPNSLGGVILLATPFILCSAICIMFPVWTLLLITEVLTQLGIWGKIVSSVLLLSFSAWTANVLLKDWFGAKRDESFRGLILIALIAAVLLYPLPIMRMKRKAVRLTTEGDYDGALRISKIWLRSKVYGRPFQGWVMAHAGRYREALELLEGAAFDAKGRPLLKTQHLYFYAVALMNEEKYLEAQPLLEAAVLVPQKMGEYFRFSLAECLLSQNKEASRACEQMEHLIADLKKKAQPKPNRIFLAQCMAVHAWALASCGRREEAESRLEEAFVESDSYGKDDLAGLWHLAGSTKQALGDNEMARAAFLQAFTVFPHGSIALQARRKLAKLGQNVLG